MNLIIAEKPVLARSITDALPGASKSENGVTIKGDYVVTSLFGHLLTLKKPEEYDEDLKKWSLDRLPIYFKDWGKSVSTQSFGGKSGASSDTPASRLKRIGELLKKADVVVHAGDPDDEGQYLVDEILSYFGYKGKVLRLATGDTSQAALKKALANMEDNALHVRRGESAYARSVADFMVGINLSRYFTLKNPETLITVGRVQTPTLGLVVRRDEQIENHQVVKFYTNFATVAIEGAEVRAKYVPSKNDSRLDEGRITNIEHAKQIQAMISAMGKNIEGMVQSKPVLEQPPLPFNLTELSVYCERHFGYTPKDTLDITQSLRDKYNCISYNRSDCQYLSSNQFNEAPDVMQHVVSNIGFKPAAMDLSIKSRAFDDKYVSGEGAVAHLAIIPQAVSVDIKAMTDRERNVYLAICKYYMAQFMPPAKKTQTKLTINTPDGAKLESTSTVIIDPGYRAIFKEAEQEASSPLSNIADGLHYCAITDTAIEEGETNPPPRYTQATLAKDMARIAKFVSNPEVKRLLLEKDKDHREENGSIGTEATRASIISGLIDHGYLEMNSKGKIVSTQLGREIIRILPQQLTQPDLTALWWVIQEDIKAGSANHETLESSVLEMINDIIRNEYPKVDTSKLPPELLKSGPGGSKVPLGTCPLCGNTVIEGKLGYGCMGYKNGCKFVLWKNQKMPMLKNITFTKTDARAFLSGKTVFKKGLMKKDGSMFHANLRMECNPNSQYPVNIRPDFSQKPATETKKRSSAGRKRTKSA